MDNPPSNASRTVVATVEVSDRAPSLCTWLEETGHAFELQPSAKSPPGYAWFDLSIAAGMSEQRTAAIAAALLQTMQERSEHGQLEGFRIVAGQFWLELHANHEARHAVGASLAVAAIAP